MADFKKPKPGGGGGGNSSLELIVFGLLAIAIFYSFTGLVSPIFNPVGLLSGVRQYFSPIINENLWWLKIVSVIFSALFLWGIIHIIRKTNYLVIKREQYMEILGKDYLSRDRTLRAWKQILERLNSEDANNWRLAILEADHILNEILKMSGYLGSMDEKLPKLEAEQLSNIEDVKRAHAIRDKISNDPAFPITKEEAADVIRVYEASFRELNLLRD